MVELAPRLTFVFTADEVDDGALSDGGGDDLSPEEQGQRHPLS